MLPQVTVVIPTYDGARRLPLMLRNLTAQDAVDGSFEVVVVDNNSTDDTAAVVCLSGGQAIAAFYEPHLKLALDRTAPTENPLFTTHHKGHPEHFVCPVPLRVAALWES